MAGGIEDIIRQVMASQGGGAPEEAAPAPTQMAMNDNPGNKMTIPSWAIKQLLDRAGPMGEVDRTLYGDEVGAPANNNPAGGTLKPLQVQPPGPQGSIEDILNSMIQQG